MKKIIITAIVVIIALFAFFFLTNKIDKEGFVEGEITEIFKATLPIQHIESNVFEDGGTAFVVLKDASGKEFVFCLDGRIETTWDGQLRYFYIGAIHPEEEGALRVPYGGEEERELLKIIKSWDSSKWEPIDKYDNTKNIVIMIAEELEGRKKWVLIFRR